jgi:hypothetical protein
LLSPPGFHFFQHGAIISRKVGDQIPHQCFFLQLG